MRGIRATKNRDGSWACYVSVTRGGDRQRRKQSGFANRREAEAWGLETKRRADLGTPLGDSRMTLRDLVESWLTTLERAGAVKASTLQSYGETMRAHVLPRFGDVQLANLTRRGIDLWIGELYRNGRSTAGNAGRHGALSPKTVHNVHSVLRTALRQAVRWGLITSNPAEGVTLPRTQPKQPATWQADDMAGFLAAIESHRLAGPLRLLAMTGLRRGEWLGLRWSAVDLNSATLSITTTRVRVGREMVETDPKTARGRRTIPIDPQTVEALRAWRRAQAAEMLAAGAGRSSELLVTNAAGLPLTTSALRRQLDGVIRDAGLPRITPHGLRHSHATLARDTTELEEVSRRLGHSDPSFTARVYVAPRSEHQRAGVDELAQRLSSRKRGA